MSRIHFLVSTDNETYTERKRIALQTVPVNVMKCICTYALLDSGSQDSFEDNVLVEQLLLKTNKYKSITVCTLSGEKTRNVNSVSIVIQPVNDQNKAGVCIKEDKVIQTLNVLPTTVIVTPQRSGVSAGAFEKCCKAHRIKYSRGSSAVRKSNW